MEQPGLCEPAALDEVLERLDEPSLHKLHADHDGNVLQQKIAQHS